MSDRRYFKEFEAANGHTIRVNWIPRSTSGDDITDLDEKEIPDDCGVAETIGGGELGWEKIIAGVPKLGDMKMRLNVRPLHGIADYAQLEEALLKPRIAGGCTITGADGYTRSIPTSTMLQILTNDGSGTPDRIIFEGVLRRLPTREHEITKDGKHIIDFTFVNVATYVLSQIRAEDVIAQEELAATDIAPQQYVFDWVVKYGSQIYGKAFGLSDNSEGWHPAMLFYKLRYLYGAIANVASQIYRSLRRSSGYDFRFNSAEEVSDPLASGEWGTGNPYDVITNYKSFYAPTAALVGSALTRNERYILGRIIRSDTSVLIGGLFSNRSRISFFGWKTALEFLQESSIGGCSKVVPMYDSGLHLVLYFARIYEAHPRVGAKSIDMLDIPGTTKPIEGAHVLGSATSNHPGANNSDDETEMRVDNDWSIESEETEGVHTVFHNLPYNGPADKRTYLVNGGLDMMDTLSTYMVMVTPSAPTLGIYYADTPADITTSQCMFRAHHKTDIDTGRAIHSVNHTCTIPTPDIDGENPDLVFGTPLRAVNVDVQRHACLPKAAADVIAKEFGGEFQNEIVLTRPITEIDPGDLGALVDTADWPDGTVYDNAGETTMAHWPGEPVVRNIKWSLKKSQSEVAFLSLGEGS